MNTFLLKFHPACLLSIVCSILILCIVKANGTTESKEILDSANQVKSSSNLATNLKDDVITLENKPVEDREGEDLLDIAALKQKIAETEIAMTKIIARMSQIVPKTQVS